MSIIAGKLTSKFLVSSIEIFSVAQSATALPPIFIVHTNKTSQELEPRSAKCTVDTMQCGIAVSRKANVDKPNSKQINMCKGIISIFMAMAVRTIPRLRREMIVHIIDLFDTIRAIPHPMSMLWSI